MANVSVIYHHYPHYRAAVMREMNRSNRHNYTFFGSTDEYEGIKPFKGDDELKIQPITFCKKSIFGPNIKNFEIAVSPQFDATIILGNINSIGTWRALSEARRNGLATAYWAHGWLRKENYIKAKIRNYYFNRANLVLTYGSRAIKIAQESGFPINKIKSIWNSLDWDFQNYYYEKFSNTPKNDLRLMIGMPVDIPIVLTISRITDLCHYDWLIKAVSQLRSNPEYPIEIWMIGNGPALPEIIQQAKNLKVPLHIKGEQYDEAVISQHIMASDVVASPGKIGLTAIHALTYGTPVITHGALDQQMPEVEAIVPGKSGEFFSYGDTTSLATALHTVLQHRSTYATLRQDCRATILDRYTPKNQCRLINDAIDEITNVNRHL